MKIFVVIHESSLSGANLGLLESLISLRSSNIQFTFLSPTFGSLNKELQLHFPQAQQLIFPFRWWMSLERNWIKMYPIRILFRNFLTIWDVVKILRIDKPDLIWSNTIAVNIGFYMSKILGVKHMWYLHEFGTLDHGFKFNFSDYFGHLVLQNGGFLVANSAVVSKHYSKIARRKIPFIHYSMESFLVEDSIKYTESVSSAIIYGRISQNKGHLLAVNAFCDLIDDGYNIELTIMGNSDDDLFLDNLVSIIGRRKMRDKIKIIDYNPNPINVVSRHDVVLNCSLNEAFGRINIEARKLGKIIVASETGSSGDLIKHGVDGFLFPRSEKGLYECMINLKSYSNQDLRVISRNGYEYSRRNFNNEVHLNQLNSILLLGDI